MPTPASTIIVVFIVQFVVTREPHQYPWIVETHARIHEHIDFY